MAFLEPYLEKIGWTYSHEPTDGSLIWVHPSIPGREFSQEVAYAIQMARDVATFGKAPVALPQALTKTPSILDCHCGGKYVFKTGQVASIFFDTLFTTTISCTQCERFVRRVKKTRMAADKAAIKQWNNP